METLIGWNEEPEKDEAYLQAGLIVLGLALFAIDLPWVSGLMVLGMVLGGFLLSLGFLSLSFDPEPSELCLDSNRVYGRADSIYKWFWSYPKKRFVLEYSDIADVHLVSNAKAVILTITDSKGRHYEFASVNNADEVQAFINRCRG